ncbi:MAG: polyhydroxyalkanoate synthesis repressor PhaR [Pseudomonadota bacterium]
MSKKKTDPDGPVRIKKYPNRRLYNTASSKYIKLDDVVELVKDGTEFIIEEAKSGEDITRTILNQIIFEQEVKPKDFLFPLEFQKQLISLYGNAYGTMVPDYLTQSLTLLAKERQTITDAVGEAVTQNTKAVMDYSQALARQNMDLFKRSMALFGVNVPDMAGMTGMTGMTDPASAEAPKNREEEMALVQKQIDDLQARLAALKDGA